MRSHCGCSGSCDPAAPDGAADTPGAPGPAALTPLQIVVGCAMDAASGDLASEPARTASREER